MSIKVMTAVWANAPVRQGSLLVLLALADFANDNGICWPSVPTLSEKAHVTERHVQRILRQLERKKLIVVDKGTGPFGASTYKVLCERGDKMSPLTKCRGVTSTTEGVTSETPGGDAHVTQTVIEPSLVEPSGGSDTGDAETKELEARMGIAPNLRGKD